MDITKFNEKAKALSLTLIDAQEKGAKTVINS